MNTNTWTMQDAKNKFCRVVDAAYSGTPQYVTKRGMLMVAIVNAEYLKKLEQYVKPTLADYLLSMPKDDREFERIHAKPGEVEF